MRNRLSVWTILTCLTASGCGGSGSKSPADVFPVNGVVTYNGNPLEGAIVTFFAVDVERTASGMTNAEGAYQLTTFTSNDGAVVGKQAVSIVKGGVHEAAPLPDDQSPDYDPIAVMRPTPVSKPPIPVKYTDKATSGLDATVTAEGPNQFNFELQD